MTEPLYKGLTPPLTFSFRGLPGLEGQTFTTEDAEDGLVITVNGHDIVALDIFYAGLFIGGPPGTEGEIPRDDPDDRPKIIVGAWPNGEEWVRLHEVPLATIEDHIDPADRDEDLYGHCDSCGARCDDRGCIRDRSHVPALSHDDPRQGSTT